MKCVKFLLYVVLLAFCVSDRPGRPTALPPHPPGPSCLVTQPREIRAALGQPANRPDAIAPGPPLLPAPLPGAPRHAPRAP